MVQSELKLTRGCGFAAALTGEILENGFLRIEKKKRNNKFRQIRIGRRRYHSAAMVPTWGDVS